MNISGRIVERAINAAMVLLLFLTTGIYSCFAQTLAGNAKNAMGKIRIVENVNVDAKAFPIKASINSPYHEIKPALTPCGQRLYFSRYAHPDNSAGILDHEDIYYTDFDKETNTWSDPVRMPGYLNNAYPNYVNNISNTGDTIILGNQYIKKNKMRAGLSYSVRVNGVWSFPTTINIQGDYNMSNHANHYVSLKNGVIISSVQRADSKGERDLYVSFWDGNVATEPVSMGSVINTEMEESSPYLASDNKTLYFASKGHHGMGGYDIYVTKRLDDSWTNWSQPENLGPAVNSDKDDEFFSITHDGEFAIFSRQINVHNVDLYKISMEDLFDKPKKQVKPINITTSLASL